MTRGAILALLAAALLLGCGPDLSGVTYPAFLREPDYALPKQLRLVVYRSPRAEALDDGGFVATTALVVQDDLRQQGVEAEIVEGHGHEQPVPRITLSFIGFDEGSDAGHLAAGAIGAAGVAAGGVFWVLAPAVGIAVGWASSADIDVRCSLIDAHGKALLDARVRGQGKSPRDASEALGHAIAKVLLDVHFPPPPPNYEPPP